MVWVVFSLTLLAAVAIEKLWRRPVARGLYWTRLATAGGAACNDWRIFGLVFSARSERLPLFRRRLLLAFGVWGPGCLTLLVPIESTIAKRRLMWMVAAAVWVSVDLLVAGWWINPDIELRFFAQQTHESELANAARQREGLSIFVR